MASMALLAVFGIVSPLRHARRPILRCSQAITGFSWRWLAVYGYMLTELGHYGIYQPPKYTTRSEKLSSQRQCLS